MSERLKKKKPLTWVRIIKQKKKIGVSWVLVKVNFVINKVEKMGFMRFKQGSQ